MTVNTARRTVTSPLSAEPPEDVTSPLSAEPPEETRDVRLRLVAQLVHQPSNGLVPLLSLQLRRQGVIALQEPVDGVTGLPLPDRGGHEAGQSLVSHCRTGEDTRHVSHWSPTA